MHPTLRHCLEATSRVVSSLLPQKRRPSRAKPRRRAVPELAPLEDRMLLFFNVAASAVPNTLWPPNGRFVPVTITGTLREFSLQGNKPIFQKLGGPKKANFQVVDEYRRDEPAGPLNLVDVGGGKFTFSVTIHLEAERAAEFPAGRRYYILVAGQDIDGWGSKTVTVQVPHSLQDRGPGPLEPGPPKIHGKTTLHGHPKGVLHAGRTH
jgi:hypothetical protein